MRDFIKDEKDRKKLQCAYLRSAKRRQKSEEKKRKKMITGKRIPIIDAIKNVVMKKNKEGPESRKPADPKHQAEARRFLYSKKKELESPEARIFLKFLPTWPEADVTLAACEMIWGFLQWLKASGYLIINEKTVFCWPLSHLVKYRNLK